jgi:energy-coupling factor transporter ATP-binding protein EcfA2
MSSSTSSSDLPLISVASRIFQDVLGVALTGNTWHKVHMTAVPLLASAVWYFSRTVIRVADEQQALWIQMWLSQQSKALERVRRLQLLPSTTTTRAGRDRRGRIHAEEEEEEEDKEEDGGRFAPPKLDFQPDDGVVTWTFFGWWPVSVSSAGAGEAFDPYSGTRSKRSGYTLTVWFAPCGRSVVRSMLFQGRKLWLAKRAKKTEIWMMHRHHGGFKIVTRPSRPLSSVIVEGDKKEHLRQDAIHFLNAEKWYISKGIPYRRGYLLHGPPGCGKTSLITALAGDLRMPIVVVSLNDRDMDDGALMETLRDAPKNSLVLIEDIDCALPKETSQRAAAAVMNRYGGRPVTFSGLLNAIDGVGAQEGRLLFMTTNHIDRLDEALIRPGRVDVQYHLGRASKAGAGELFDQFFDSSVTQNDFSPETIQEGRKTFLEKVEDGVHSFASLQGIFMSAKDDPRKVTDGMDQLISSPCKGQDPTRVTAYDKVMEIEKSTKEALEKERQREQAQREAGKIVVKRLIGNPTHTTHNIEMQQIVFCGCFPTFGAPDKLTTSGVLYYEIEVIKAHGFAQFGFALKDGIPVSELDTGEGVGDNGNSWAVDGMRGRLWHNGSDTEWKGLWAEGSVLGLAANVDTGMVAVSKNGDWGDGGDSGFGVVFCNKSIQKGVFPAFTASRHTVRYRFQGDDAVQYGPPPESVWDSKKKEAVPVEAKSE